jgi:UDP-GlcNAc:undecaprenyl-phosphate GlcNAc-1-phosphate transferase
MIFIVVFATAFFFAIALTPVAMWLSRRIGTVDQPAARRVHTAPTPRFGGLPLFGAFFAAVAVSLFYPRSDSAELLRLAGLTVGAILLFLVGAYDDHRELNAAPQLITQVVAAGIAVASGVLIVEVRNPLGGILSADLPIHFDSWFAILFTIFWIVGMTNTVNWLDGIDGLAAGVIVIAGIVLFVHTINLEQYSISLLALALVGAVLGFLLFNFPPAKIFMGSAGALVLGYLLGVLSIIGAARVAFALLVLGIPIMDVAWQIISRVRAGQSPFHATRTHLHHRLLDAGLSQRMILLLYYLFTALFGLLALALPSPVYKLVTLVIIAMGGLMLLVKISRVSANRKRKAEASSRKPSEARVR